MGKQRGDSELTHERAVWFRAIAAVAIRPWLWSTALRQLHRSTPRGWWRRPPFVPRPEPAYIRFRLETAYGNGGAPRAADLVSFLAWCRARRSTDAPTQLREGRHR